MDKRSGDQFFGKHVTAVQQLDEIMAARGQLVQYAMVSTGGLIPAFTYVYNAKCEGKVTYGMGPSIEKAIENAAIEFLEKFACYPVQADDHLLNSMNSLKIESNPNVKLTYNQIDSNNATTNQNSTLNTRKKKPIDFGEGLSKNEAENDAVNIALDQIYHGKNKTKMSANYIGTLQEKCAARGWELPKYEYHQENDNEIHKLFYSVICSDGPHESTGVGNSKQLAKNQVAQIVCDKINLDQENNTSVLPPIAFSK